MRHGTVSWHGGFLWSPTSETHAEINAFALSFSDGTQLGIEVNSATSAAVFNEALTAARPPALPGVHLGRIFVHLPRSVGTLDHLAHDGEHDVVVLDSLQQTPDRLPGMVYGRDAAQHEPWSWLPPAPGLTSHRFRMRRPRTSSPNKAWGSDGVNPWASSIASTQGWMFECRSSHVSDERQFVSRHSSQYG